MNYLGNRGPNEAHGEESSFYQVKDPATGRKYLIPDLSSDEDLLKIVRDATGAPSKHPPEVKVQAAALYAVLGNMTKVSAMMGIERITMVQWKKQPWWHIAMRQVRKEKNEELDAQLTGLMEQVVQELQDRIVNGETIVGKDGELRQIPVAAKTLATVLGITFDKRTILRADPTSKVANSDVAEHLTKVADKLERLVGKIPEPTIVEGEFTSVEQ